MNCSGRQPGGRIARPATWHAAQEGYVAAAMQRYVLRREGTAWATAYVTRDAAQKYTAHLGTLCHPDVPPPSPR